MGFPGGSDGKESAGKAGDRGSISGLGRSFLEGHGYPLQYSSLENPMDKGASQATVWVAESDMTEQLTQNTSFSSVAQCCRTLRPHGLQHAKAPCPSLTPRAYSNSCALSWWCHPTISFSVVPFSSCPQSFPGSGSFLMSQFFTSGDHSIGTSASASVLPVNIQKLLLGIPYVWWIGSNCSEEFSLVLWMSRCESLWVYPSWNLLSFSDIFHQIWGRYLCRYSFRPSPLCVCWSLLVSRVSLSLFTSLSVPQSGNLSWQYSFTFAGSTLFLLRSALEPLREF